MREQGPWVLMAMLCDRVEGDDQNISLIGIGDFALIDAEQVTRAIHGPPTRHRRNLMLILVHDRDCEGQLRLDYVYPSGRRITGTSVPFRFESQVGRYRGEVPAGIEIDGLGLYWFELFFDDRLLTRIPFRVGVSGLVYEGP